MTAQARVIANMFEALQERLPICEIPNDVSTTSLKSPDIFLKWIPNCLRKRLLVGDFRILQPWCIAVLAALARREDEVNTYPVFSRQAQSSLFAYSLGLGAFSGDGTISIEEKKRTVKIQRISKYSEIDNLAEKIASLTLTDVSAHYIDSVEVKELIKYIITELLRNVIQHSGDKNGGVVIAQRMDQGSEYENNKSVQICVVDRGIGIYDSLKRMHSNIEDNNAALEHSLWPSFSGTFAEGLTGSEQNAGMGLFFISEIVKRTAGRLLIASGSTSLFLEGDPNGNGNNLIKTYDVGFDGTIVAIDIPKRSCADFEELLKKVQQTAYERSIDRERIHYIDFSPKDLKKYLVIKMSIANEDTSKAEKFSQKYLIPSINTLKPLCLDFSGYNIITQSFIHAMLFSALKKAYELKVPIAVINVTPAMKDVIALLEWYALGVKK